MTLVVDASFVVAALVDSGAEGRWAEALVADEAALVAPHFMPVEVANILRRAVLSKDLSEDAASMVHDDLLALRVELFPYAPLAERAWALRGNLTAYDAWYVALAEAVNAPLATLDGKLARAPGPRCSFCLPTSVPRGR